MSSGGSSNYVEAIHVSELTKTGTSESTTGEYEFRVIIYSNLSFIRIKPILFSTIIKQHKTYMFECKVNCDVHFVT